MSNGRITDQTADFLQEQQKFMETCTYNFQMGNTLYDPQYEEEFFPKSDISRILEEDRDSLRKPISQEERLNALRGIQNDKNQA